MTQHADTHRRFARPILVAAALAAAFAIGFAISRGGGGNTANQPAGAEAAVPQSIESLEARTKANPQDLTAWQALGIACFNASRFAEAAGAYEKAVELAPDDALTWSALGEARVMASERDPMPVAALDAFRHAAAIDPKEPRARYFLAVKRDLDGDHGGAIGDWLALLAETPENAPWRGDLVRTIEQVGKINGIDVTRRLADAGAKSPPAPPMPAVARAIPGPTQQDLAAASRIPPGEQREMAEGMVTRLEQRLKANPGDADGWIMLIRSRVTLDQPEKASGALASAVAANPTKAKDIRKQAAILGVK